MVQRMQLVRGEKFAAVLVIGEGVVFPGVPQALDHIQVFLGDAIAHGMGWVLGFTEVIGGAAEPGGHHVPTGAAAADMVQGGKLARHLVGLGVADGHGGDQADIRRQRGQCRQNGQRLETVEVMRAGFGMDMQAVGDEHKVKFGGFGQLGLLLVERKMGAGIWLRLQVAPFAPAVADAMHHGPQFQMPWCGWMWLAHVLLLQREA